MMGSPEKVRASNKLRRRLRDHDPRHPPRPWMEGEARPEWSSTPQATRLRIVQRESEFRRGIAISKDRMCGRKKYDLEGFFGLELDMESLYRLSCSGKATTPQLAEAAERVKQRQAKLAADEVEIERAQEIVEAAKDVEAHAARNGMTVSEWLAACVKADEILCTDHIGGVFAVCEHVKADPLQVFAHVLQLPPGSLPSEQSQVV